MHHQLYQKCNVKFGTQSCQSYLIKKYERVTYIRASVFTMHNAQQSCIVAIFYLITANTYILPNLTMKSIDSCSWLRLNRKLLSTNIHTLTFEHQLNYKWSLQNIKIFLLTRFRTIIFSMKIQLHSTMLLLKTRSHSRIKNSELTAANRRIANTHSNDLRMQSP